MAQIKTRIIIRNDSAANWEVNKSAVLLKGEFGVEFLTDGTAKIKIGDGTTTWENLAYYGSDVKKTQVFEGTGDISTIVGSAELQIGDIVIVTDGSKKTTSIYNGTNWVEIQGSVNIEFDENVFVKAADETVGLLGFESADTGAQLTKGANGKLSWVKPDTTTAEGLATEVANLKTAVGDSDSGLIKEVADINTALGDKANSSDVYTKSETDALISSVYSYKGSVATYADLPTENLKSGDVYNIEASDFTHGIRAGDNVAWTGTQWDVLSGFIDLSAYAKKDELPTIATADKEGLVKSSTTENNVKVLTDGTMEVNSLNINKLVQTEGEYLILNGGASLI